MRESWCFSAPKKPKYRNGEKTTNEETTERVTRATLRLAHATLRRAAGHVHKGLRKSSAAPPPFRSFSSLVAAARAADLRTWSLFLATTLTSQASSALMRA
jgi:hypothetical protein